MNLAVCLLTAAIAGADAPVTLRSLFPSEAPVAVERPGIARLELPPAILGACRADLSDLRIIDRAGKEVPYVMDAPLDPGTAAVFSEVATPEILDIHREEERRETGPAIQREKYVIATPAAPPQAEEWRLHIRTNHARFVRRLRVTAVPDAGERIPVLEEGSVFRLPPGAGPGERMEKTVIALPYLPAGRLEIAIQGEEGFFLEPRFELRRSRIYGGAEQMVVPLEEISRRQDAGRTVIELGRPAGLVPVALRIRTTTSWFDRRFDVVDTAADRGRASGRIGRGRLFRVQASAPIEDLELELARAGGDRLRVEILDQDSPPLEDLAILAVVRQPALLFPAEGAPAGPGAFTLLFGGGRALPPRYDLAVLRPLAGARGARAIAAAWMSDPSRRSRASLGEPRANPAFEGSPALAWAMRAGAAVDTRLYRHARAVRVAASPEGVTRLRLSPADLGVAREDLGDLRIVDRDARQWPYLVERAGATEEIGLALSGREHDGTETVYRLGLPVPVLRLDEISIEAPVRFVDRPYRLVATTPPDENQTTLARGRLVRRVHDRGALRIPLGAARVASLELRIEDGSEAPLEIAAVKARLPLPDLFLTVPQGEYRLLVGNPDDAPPRYELEAVRDVVLAVASVQARGEELAANPDYRMRARFGASPKGIETVSLWIVLAGAVVVLGALTLRLARREPGPPAGG